MFVIGGTIWSLTHTKILGGMDHVFNGVVFAKMMNLLSIVGGFSVGLHALIGLSKNKNLNLGILGFIVVHFTIVALLWVAAPNKFKKEPLPDRVIDRVFEFKEKMKFHN